MRYIYKNQKLHLSLEHSNAIIFKTKNGMFGEVQINTPEIIYAKETESRGRKMLGDKKYEEIAKRIGVKGGDWS